MVEPTHQIQHMGIHIFVYFWLFLYDHFELNIHITFAHIALNMSLNKQHRVQWCHCYGSFVVFQYWNRWICRNPQMKELGSLNAIFMAVFVVMLNISTFFCVHFRLKRGTNPIGCFRWASCSPMRSSNGRTWPGTIKLNGLERTSGPQNKKKHHKSAWVEDFIKNS